ncbi:MAG: hypothetical protein ACO3NL_07710 [Phycisphaerales bacterium]
MSRRRASLAIRVAWSLLLPTLAGCATSAPPTAPTPDQPPDPRLKAAQPSDESRVGIETRQWLVASPPDRIAAAITAWASGDGADLEPSLRRIDGLLLAKGSASSLPDLLESLGGSRTDLRVWHGQALEWRDLAGVQIGRATIAMVAGRPQPIAPGRLSLVMRGWGQPMERGAACEIELGLRWKPERRASISLEERGASDLRWVGELADRFDVARDEVVVIASEPTPAPAETGPPVAVPPTLGRLILPEPAHGLATVVVIWPNLPPRLFPDAAEQASSQAPAETASR